MPDQTQPPAAPMPGTTPGTDVREVAAAFAPQAERFLQTCVDVATGVAPEAAIPLLLLATSDVLGAGARLGAMVDVVPPTRSEPDDGEETDVDPLRIGLALVLEGIDGYTEVVDPVLSDATGDAELSADLATVAAALGQGLQHYEAGHVVEALWWWQFSYLTSWGDRGASAVRVLALILGHLRTDVLDDPVVQAELEALED